MHWISRPHRLLPSLALALALAAPAGATTVASTIPVSGNFHAGVAVSGNAQLHAASGTFKQWLLFGHVNIGVSASPQTVPVSLTSSPNVNVNGGGTIGMTYDDVSPGTPLAIDSANIDINGAGGANTPINFDLAVGNLNINTSLGTFQLQLSVDAEISDLVFDSTLASAVFGGNGGSYAIPGDLTATLNGIVKGRLVNVPILGTIDLGTLYTLSDAPLAFNVPLPGDVTTTDLEIGNPFPHDLQAEFELAIGGLTIPFPFDVPIDIDLSQSVPNGQSGFSELHVDATLAATITLSNPQYHYTGVLSDGLVPEPSLAMLLGVGLLGMALRSRAVR